MDSSKTVESQGQRLSTYASSSSSSHPYNSKSSPKTPKKSPVAASAAEKLSNRRSSSKEEALSPNHLYCGHSSYASVSSPVAKAVHAECVLKCTCNRASYTSLRSPKQQQQPTDQPGTTSMLYEKNVQKFSKISCDAATSPSRFSQRSPQINLRLNGNDSSMACNELRISDEKTITAKTNVSPRRLIATRNAATSPGLDKRKQLSTKYELKNSNVTSKSILEKSNSLGDSKPSRTLRTTRSLSPRPPVRHQHAVTVCDENDIVSIKISPNEDFEEELSETRFEKKKYKAQSEQTSPNLSDLGTKFTFETGVNNKSTGCLVYVPSDPWMKMTEPPDTGREKRERCKFSPKIRSLSRGDLLPLTDDPWIWRKNPETDGSTTTAAKSSKPEVYRQAKSYSVTKFELTDFTKSSSGSNGEKHHHQPKKHPNRPKLQRCKSPIVIEDELEPPPPFSPNNDMNRTCTCNAVPIVNEKQQLNCLSPLKDAGNKEALASNHIPTNYNSITPPTKTFLNVNTTTFMQSRHSFSSISQKDDELQLNIRRLSEQIKKPGQGNNNTSGNVGSGADFTDYLNQFRTVEAQKVKEATRNSSKNLADSVLETTC